MRPRMGERLSETGGGGSLRRLRQPESGARHGAPHDIILNMLDGVARGNGQQRRAVARTASATARTWSASTQGRAAS
jgi:hypothetical protein